MRVLFLCTGNSARSQMAEALFNAMAAPAHQAESAGSHPAGYVHPLAISTLERFGIAHDQLVSKSLSALTGPFDLVITLCDRAAAEPCPLYTATSRKAHWGLPDPAAVAGTLAEQQAAFEAVLLTLKERICALLRDENHSKHSSGGANSLRSA